MCKTLKIWSLATLPCCRDVSSPTTAWLHTRALGDAIGGLAYTCTWRALHTVACPGIPCASFAWYHMHIHVVVLWYWRVRVCAAVFGAAVARMVRGGPCRYGFERACLGAATRAAMLLNDDVLNYITCVSTALPHGRGGEAGAMSIGNGFHWRELARPDLH